MNWRAEPIAFVKVLLHAYKHSSQCVCGVFLVSADDNQHIVDTIPLFHGHPLAPMLEIAFDQIEKYAKSVSLQIGGFYYANERLTDNNVPPVAIQIITKIRSLYPDAILALLNNEATVHTDKKIMEAIQIFSADGSSSKSSLWSRTGLVKVTDEDTALSMLRELMQSCKFLHLIDFDAHLDDPVCDWRNIELFESFSSKKKTE